MLTFREENRQRKLLVYRYENQLDLSCRQGGVALRYFLKAAICGANVLRVLADDPRQRNQPFGATIRARLPDSTQVAQSPGRACVLPRSADRAERTAE